MRAKVDITNFMVFLNNWQLLSWPRNHLLCGTQMFIIIFMKAHHCTLVWVMSYMNPVCILTLSFFKKNFSQ